MSKKNYTQVLFIDSTLSNWKMLLNFVNSSTLPILYSYALTSKDILKILNSHFTTINRIAFATDSIINNKYFINYLPFFNYSDIKLLGEENKIESNFSLLIKIIKDFNVNNIDFLINVSSNNVSVESFLMNMFYKALTNESGVISNYSDKEWKYYFKPEFDYLSNSRVITEEKYEVIKSSNNAKETNNIDPSKIENKKYLESFVFDTTQPVTTTTTTEPVTTTTTTQPVTTTTTTQPVTTTTTTSPPGTYTWTDLPVNTAVWSSVSINSLGNNLVACSAFDGNGGGYISISTDGGNTWNNLTQSNIPNNATWTCVATDSNGNKILACSSYKDGIGGDVYLSNNGGITWTDFSNNGIPTGALWTHVAADFYFQNMIACSSYNGTNGGEVYISNNGGLNWGLSNGIPTGELWTSVAMDSTGTHIVACSKYNTTNNTGGDVYIYKNGGWSPTGLPSNTNWTSVAINSTGTNIVACSSFNGNNGGYVYVSNNTGTSWKQTILPKSQWQCVSIDETGQNIIGCSYNIVNNRKISPQATSGVVVNSRDGGTTWDTIPTPPGSQYLAVAINPNGDSIVGASTTSVFKGVFEPTPTTTPATTNPVTTTTTIPMSNICFAKGTMILTDQGPIEIEKIDILKHTILEKNIVAITQTITNDKYVVCFEKDALSYGCPNEKTIMTYDHKIIYKGEILAAKHFIGHYKRVKKEKYDGEIMYNILLKTHEKIQVNGLTCETLHPQNAIAKLYTNYYTNEYNYNLIVMMNDSIKRKDVVSYKKIMDRL